MEKARRETLEAINALTSYISSYSRHRAACQRKVLTEESANGYADHNALTCLSERASPIPQTRQIEALKSKLERQDRAIRQLRNSLLS